MSWGSPWGSGWATSLVRGNSVGVVGTGMAKSGGWTWLRIMAAVAGAAFVVALFLPKSIMPPEKLPYAESAFTTLIGLAAGAEARQRTKEANGG